MTGQVVSITIKADPVKRWEAFRAVALLDGPAEYVFSNYASDEQADWGYWTASFRIMARDNLLFELLENGLDRHVESWDETLQQDFEGKIWEMTLNYPPNQYRVTMANAINEIWMRADYNGNGSSARTTTLTNDDAQSRYGTIVRVLGGAEYPSLAVADQTVQTYLDLKGWPRPSAHLGAGRGAPYIDVSCRSYARTLERRVYNQTALTGTQAAHAVVKDILDSVGEFIGVQDRGVNPTLTTRVYDADRDPESIIQAIAQAGDSNYNRWVASVYGRAITEAVGRRFYFQPASPSAVAA